MEFVSQTGLAESIQDIDSQIAKAEADAKLEAEKAAKKKQEQWAKDHPLENALRNFSDGIGSWWNGIVKGTKGLNTEGFFLLETGKGILLALESTVGFVGEGISSLAIGSVQVGQLLGGGLATGINNLRGVKSPDWIGKDWSGTVKNVQALTPSAIFEMSKAAIGSMADDFKRGDIYAMTTDVLTVGTMLTAANGLKNTAKNVTTKLRVTRPQTLGEFLKEMDELPRARLSKKVEDGLVSTPKGERFDPSIYMSKAEIEAHLSIFDDGVVKIQSIEEFNNGLRKFGGSIGHPKTGTYVLPKNVVDKAISVSNGDPKVLEKLLGLEPGYLGKNPVLLDINKVDGLRVPTGNEAGAWQGLWEPGGEFQKQSSISFPQMDIQ
ncbi:hypothetical protein [Enterococcus sp. AZ126]|uniref:hypothetical protein n=1 Tax=Enterococcus sp. AZ126 TaxID=2774635 RepID=UPI003F687DD5